MRSATSTGNPSIGYAKYFVKRSSIRKGGVPMYFSLYRLCNSMFVRELVQGPATKLFKTLLLSILLAGGTKVGMLI